MNSSTCCTPAVSFVMIAHLLTAVADAQIYVDADKVVDVVVDPDQHLGVGFGHLPPIAHDLAVVLRGPAGESGQPKWVIHSSEVVDGSGMFLWHPRSNTSSNTFHPYQARGVLPDDPHAVHIHGKLVQSTIGGQGGGTGAGTAGTLPEFDASVAYLDADIDSEGPPGSALQDENEYGWSGAGMGMPVTQDVTALPITLPSSDVSGAPLTVKIHTHVAGTLEFGGYGPGVGIYRWNSVMEQSELISQAIPIEPGTWHEVFRIHTGNLFLSGEDIEVKFVPNEGVGDAEDIVTVFPMTDIQVAIDVDANNDGRIDEADFPVKRESPGATVIVAVVEHGRLSIRLPDGMSYEGLLGYRLAVETTGVGFAVDESSTETYHEFLLEGDPAEVLPDPLEIRELRDSNDDPILGEGLVEVRLLDPQGEEVDGTVDSAVVTVKYPTIHLTLAADQIITEKEVILAVTDPGLSDVPSTFPTQNTTGRALAVSVEPQAGAGTISFHTSDASIKVYRYDPVADHYARIDSSLETFDVDSQGQVAAIFQVHTSDPFGTTDFESIVATFKPAGSDSSSDAELKVWAERVTFEIDENSPAATIVGTVPQPFQLSGQPTWSIIAGNTDGAFAVNSATGQLTVANPSPLDYEGNKHPFRLRVRAQDGDSDAEVNVGVKLRNVNEPPAFQGTPYVFSLGQGRPGNQQLTPTPPDSGYIRATDPEGDSVKYAISTNPDGLFKIDETTGIISTAAAVPKDRTEPYVVTISATDGSSSPTTTTATFNMKPLVVIVGDFHGVEGLDDTIELVFLRVTDSASLANPLTVHYTAIWWSSDNNIQSASYGDVTSADPNWVPHPGLRDRSSASVVIPAGADRYSITLEAVSDMNAEVWERFRVNILNSPAGDYAITPYRTRFKDKDDVESAGSSYVDIDIFDAVTLYGELHRGVPDRDNAGDVTTIHVNDPVQGSFGNCYFHAAIGAIAYRYPAVIADLFSPANAVSGDTITASFFETPGQPATPVNVEMTLDHGYHGAQLSGDVDGSDRVELWPNIAEKAYADFLPNGWDQLGDGGNVSKVWSHLLNGTFTPIDPGTKSDAELIQEVYHLFHPENPEALPRMVAFTTKAAHPGSPTTGKKKDPMQLSNGTQAISNHAYIGLRYEKKGPVPSDKDLVFLRNPWSSDPNSYTLELPMKDILSRKVISLIHKD